MRIAILVEGETERVFVPKLREYLKSLLPGKPQPRLDPVPIRGRIPTGEKLRRQVANPLSAGKQSADAVIALTDVFTGTNPPEFASATDAKAKMQQWVGNEPRFFPHVALYDFEAWLLPYWPKIQKLAGTNMKPPSSKPEHVNHGKPPAERIKEAYRAGSKSKHYKKTVDAARILQDADLKVAIDACPELKAFVNSILKLCGGDVLP